MKGTQCIAAIESQQTNWVRNRRFYPGACLDGGHGVAPAPLNMCLEHIVLLTKVLFSDESFVFHLETKVLESGGRVEKLIAQVA